MKTPVDYVYAKKHLELIDYFFKNGGSLGDNTKRN